MQMGENIFRRKDGRWEGRYPKGSDASGQRRYVCCYARTRQELVEKLERVRKKQGEAALPVEQGEAALPVEQGEAALPVEQGEAALPVEQEEMALSVEQEETALPAKQEEMALPAKQKKQLCLTSCADLWLGAIRNRVKESTYSHYCMLMEAHIRPVLGMVSMERISTAMLSQFSSFLLCEKHLTPVTVREVLLVLQSMLRYAACSCRAELPALHVSYPSDSGIQDVRVLNVQEQVQFTAYLLDRISPLSFGILLTMQTGLRVGELCAMRWKNINVTAGTMEVRNTLQRVQIPDPGSGTRTRLVLGPPKSSRSVRTIPLAESTIWLCGIMNPHNPECFVLTGMERPMEPRRVQMYLREMTKECGLVGVHFHTLRHTFATRCMEVGFDVKALSEILGHASVSTTLQRYVHPTLDAKRTNMQKLTDVTL